MRLKFPVARCDAPVREVGLMLAEADLELVPIVGEDGALACVVTERALARRYVRESQGASKVDSPTAIGAIVDVLQGELIAGDDDREVAGRVFVLAMDAASPTEVSDGDIAVVGDRADAQRRAIEQGAALLVTSNGT